MTNFCTGSEGSRAGPLAQSITGPSLGGWLGEAAPIRAQLLGVALVTAERS